MSDEEFLRNQRELFYDIKINASLEEESEVLLPEIFGRKIERTRRSVIYR